MENLVLIDKEKAVLHFLLESYKQNSNSKYDITPIAGKDSLMISNSLQRGWLIKDEVESDGVIVKCSININGIRLVDPDFVKAKTKEILEKANTPGKIWNVVDILKTDEKGFQFCFDLANDIYNQDYVKLLYALYPGKVMIEPTLKKLRF